MADFQNLIIPRSYNQAKITESNFTQRIEAEAKSRQNADTELQTQINDNKTNIETLRTSKQNKLTAGYNIDIINDEISCDIQTMSFKGSVENYEALPQENVVGDVWNVTATNTNYCWNGSAWIQVGTSVDLNGYYNKTQVEKLIADVLLASHPVGSLYWSSNSTNPSELFGGTWQEIKDKFILAAGDNYTNGSSGGSTERTLTIANMPEHTHTMIHSHTFSGKTQGMSGNSTGHYQQFQRGVVMTAYEPASNDDNHVYTDGNVSLDDSKIPLQSSYFRPDHADSKIDTARLRSLKIDVSHTHSFTGTTGSTSATSGATGSGESFSIMPPYVVKFCWERIA